MGYYTLFKLSVECGDSSLLESDSFKADFNRITSYDLDALDNDLLKWYDYDNNMLEISKLYPNTVFLLTGDGEEALDLWKAYYCNGESERVEVEIKFPEVDVSSIGNIKDRCPELFI